MGTFTEAFIRSKLDEIEIADQIVKCSVLVGSALSERLADVIKILLEATTAAMVYSIGILSDDKGFARKEIRQMLLPAYTVVSKALSTAGIEAEPKDLNSLTVDVLSYLGYLRVSVSVNRDRLIEPYCIHFLPADGRNITMREISSGQSSEEMALAIDNAII